jgi:phosphatidylserine decarboxylase
MRIHREGYKIVAVASIVSAILIYLIYILITPLLAGILIAFIIIIWFWTFWFFRIPERMINIDANSIVCPADGRIVVIEDVFEEEFLKEKVKQISVFMSPLDVHVNLFPVGGNVVYTAYHPGKYLLAWHPKSSQLNERSSVGIDSPIGRVLVRQIAGAMARRIACYPKAGDVVVAGEEMGFIRFGSRVDIFIPSDCEVVVSLNQKVKGGVSVLATKIPKKYMLDRP